MAATRSEADRERVLVTGAYGFTGEYVCSALRGAGYTPAPLEPAPGQHVDLCDGDAVRRRVREIAPAYVIHLAAISFVGHDDPAQFYAVNTIGTEQLLAALALEAPQLRMCVVASSANVYGNAIVDPVTESCSPAPVNHYACSKLAMEHIARTWLDKVPFVITRPFNYTGVGQTERFVVPKLVAAFARRETTLRLGNTDVTRDFSDVRDIAEVYTQLLTAGQAGDTLNLCSGVGRSLLSIVDALSEIAGYRPSIEIDAELVRRAELKRLVGSPQRLHDRIGARPRQDFASTLAWMYAQFGQRPLSSMQS